MRNQPKWWLHIILYEEICVAPMIASQISNQMPSALSLFSSFLLTDSIFLERKCSDFIILLFWNLSFRYFLCNCNDFSNINSIQMNVKSVLAPEICTHNIISKSDAVTLGSYLHFFQQQQQQLFFISIFNFFSLERKRTLEKMSKFP